MLLENTGGRIPGLCHWEGWDQDVERKSGSSLKLENTELSDGGAVFPGLCQLLLTLHQGILKGSVASDRINKEKQKMNLDIERGGRKRVPEHEEAIYICPNPGPLRPRKTSGNRNGRLGFRHWSCAVSAR